MNLQVSSGMGTLFDFPVSTETDMFVFCALACTSVKQDITILIVTVDRQGMTQQKLLQALHWISLAINIDGHFELHI